MWIISKSELGQRDVIPINDLRLHAYGPDCQCHPFNVDGIWVHNSYDGREIVERAKASTTLEADSAPLV